MPDSYQNYAELCLQHQEEVFFHIQTRVRPCSLVILAIHAGGIELGTSEIALAVAGDDYSTYLFEGLGSNTQVLHITSTHFDEPRCQEMVQTHLSCLSIHGFTGNEAEPQVYLGGRDQLLMNTLLDALVSSRYTAQINHDKFAATAPANICNRTSANKGVQMEISAGLRRQFFQDLGHRRGRVSTTPQFSRFVKTVRDALSLGI